MLTTPCWSDAATRRGLWPAARDLDDRNRATPAHQKFVAPDNPTDGTLFRRAWWANTTHTRTAPKEL